MAKSPLNPASQPLFSQIKKMIIDHIRAGEFTTAEPLPSETEFAQYYNVSQGTVRKAIAEISAENLVIRYWGRGTFVASHTEEREHSHFFHIVDNDCVKRIPQTRHLTCHRRKATREMEKRLDLRKREGVAVFERLRLTGKVPFILETIVVSEKNFPGICPLLDEHMPNELYPLYESNFQTRIIRAEECLRAVAADEWKAEVLDVEIGTPLLQIDRIAFSIGERPVEWRRSHCNTAYNHYQNTLR